MGLLLTRAYNSAGMNWLDIEVAGDFICRKSCLSVAFYALTNDYCSDVWSTHFFRHVVCNTEAVS